MDKHAIAHDQYQVTVHFSLACSPSAMRWVVKLFRPVATTEYILIAFSRFSNPRISFFRLTVLQSTCFDWAGSKICNLFLLSAQIYSLYSNHLGLWLHFYSENYHELVKHRIRTDDRKQKFMQVINFLLAR